MKRFWIMLAFYFVSACLLLVLLRNSPYGYLVKDCRYELSMYFGSVFTPLMWFLPVCAALSYAAFRHGMKAPGKKWLAVSIGIPVVVFCSAFLWGLVMMDGMPSVPQMRWLSLAAYLLQGVVAILILTNIIRPDKTSWYNSLARGLLIVSLAGSVLVTTYWVEDAAHRRWWNEYQESNRREKVAILESMSFEYYPGTQVAADNLLNNPSQLRLSIPPDSTREEIFAFYLDNAERAGFETAIYTRFAMKTPRLGILSEDTGILLELYRTGDTYTLTIWEYGPDSISHWRSSKTDYEMDLSESTE